MSKYLIIYAHPSHDSHCGYMLEQITKKLVERNKSFEFIDLYALNYNPVLQNEELYSSGRKEVSEENQEFQRKIKEAKKLIFIYPTWWQNMPAMLKGFLDRVFTSGFAFRYQNGIPLPLLIGRKAAVFSPSGGPAFYTKIFAGNSSITMLMKHVLIFTGIRSKGFSIGNARKLENNKKKIETVADKILAYLN
jgi:NAD(P)H dehydrogenase (quinone)